MASAAAQRGRSKGAIETFIIDWPVLLLLGFVFGGRAAGDPWWQTRAFAAGTVSAAAFAAVALVSYSVAPDWMWMYFLDPSDVRWAVPLMAPAYLFVFWVAFAAAVAARRLGPAALWTGAAGAIALEVAVVAITWDRYHLVGTARDWVTGTAHELITASPAGPVRTIGLLGPLFLAVTVAAYVYASRSRATAAGR